MLKHRIHSSLIDFGEPCPVTDLFGVEGEGRKLLQRLEVPEPWRGNSTASVMLIDQLERQIAKINRRLREGHPDHPYVPLLFRVPGIGWVHPVLDPTGGAGSRPTRAVLAAVRDAVRDALHAVLDGKDAARESLDAMNRASARAPRSAAARWRRAAPPLAETNYHGATRADIVLAARAADAIELLTGPRRAALRACGAPGCVLLFLKDHPRKEWCSAACGNRARQARHYARTRDRSARG